MAVVLSVVLPIFGLIALGWASTFTRLLEDNAARVLASFTYWFAIPVLLFRSLARADLPDEIPWAFLATYFAGSLVTFTIGTLAARRLGRGDATARAMVGFGSCFGNTVLMGIPLVVTGLGPEALLPYLMIVTVETSVVFALVTVMLEVGRGRDAGLSALPAKTARGIATNPMIIALALGFVWNVADLPIPTPLDRLAELLGASAVPCALFASGAALRSYRLASSIGPAATMTGLKLAVQPMVVLAVGTWLVDLPPTWLHAAVVMAALPVGVSTYAFATRYEVGEADSAAAILLSTTISVLTLSPLLVLFRTG